MPQSVKAEAKKQFTVLSKQAEDISSRLHRMPYLCALSAEQDGDDTFAKDQPWKPDLALMRECFELVAADLLKVVDQMEDCEAACQQVGAKLPDWRMKAKDYREWLDQFDIRAGKPKQVQLPELPQTFDREPTANDAHYMRGMGILWN